MKWAPTLTCALLALAGCLWAAPEPPRSRQNAFEPLFEFDDTDAPSSQAPQQRQPSKREHRLPLNESQLKQMLAQLPADKTSPPLQRVEQFAASVEPKFLDHSTSTSVQQQQQQQQQQEEEIALGSFSGPARGGQSAQKGEHWSALERYYANMRRRDPPLTDPVQQLGERDWYEPRSPHLSKPPAYRVWPTVQQQSILSNIPHQSAFDFPQDSLPGVRAAAGKQAPEESVHAQVAPGIGRGSGSVGAEGYYASALDFPHHLVQVVASKGRPADGYGGQPAAGWPSVAPADRDQDTFFQWRRLPETIYVERLNERLNHQKKTLGAIYKPQFSPELNDEAFCGPRNQFTLHLAHLAQQVKAGDGWLVEQTAANPQGLSEFPSHLGVYNASASLENYKCAASLVHDRFALTLASCAQSLAGRQILVRANEMLAGRNNTPDNSFVARPVKRVHIFPSYAGDGAGREHNLALLELEQSIDYMSQPNINPACQVRTRTQLRANYCWAPTRRLEEREYFDADGEGETRARLEVHMERVNVALNANDDAQCQKFTEIEHFSIEHPNYICSGKNLRELDNKSPLNQTSNFGAGIYCIENGSLTLVSMLQPIERKGLSQMGYLDLSYYRPWMNDIIYRPNNKR